MLKRSISLLLTASVLAVSAALFCGCNNEKSKDTEPALKPIIVGCDDYEPYNYIDEDGNFTGADIELAIEAFDRLGYTPVFYQIDWKNKDYYLNNGEIDCIWSCFTMNDREDRYTWAGPYMTSTQSVVVRADSSIASLSDLEGACVAIQATTKPEEILLSSFDPRLPEVGKVYAFSSMEDAYACLRKGYADAIAGHTSALRVFMKTAPEAYRMIDEALFVSQLGVAFECGTHTDLADSLTEVLSALKREGFTQNIAEKYGISAPEKEEE